MLAAAPALRPGRPSQKTGKLAERLLTLNSEGPRSKAYTVIAFCVAMVATDLTPAFVAGLLV
jgi:hypothetical protein